MLCRIETSIRLHTSVISNMSRSFMLIQRTVVVKDDVVNLEANGDDLRSCGGVYVSGQHMALPSAHLEEHERVGKHAGMTHACLGGGAERMTHKKNTFN